MFIQQYDHSLSESFLQFTQEMAELSRKYIDAKENTQMLRMELVGKAVIERQNYSQRSPEARYITEGLKQMEISDDTANRCHKAYLCRQDLASNVNAEFRNVSKLATYSQLYQLATAGDTTLVWDTSQYLKTNDSLPSVSQMKRYKAGYLTNKFESRAALAAERKTDEDNEPKEPASTPQKVSQVEVVVDEAPLSLVKPAIAPVQKKVDIRSLPKEWQGTAYRLKDVLKDLEKNDQPPQGVVDLFEQVKTFF